jgi:alpha-beta hydrolase superfamily lysophospholipase
MMVLRDTTPIKGDLGSERLVVLMHGWCADSPIFSIRDVEDTIREELPDADLLVPKFPSGIFSNTNLEDVCKELADEIEIAVDGRKEAGGSYQEIILIGFSLGSLIVRMTYLVGRGDRIAKLDSGVMKRYGWAEQVSRIILLAGNNRGWSMDPKPKNLLWKYYLMFLCFSPLRPLGLCKLIFSYQRGQPFVENLRMQWLRSELEKPIPPTIQLYGEEEDLVSREDMLDQQYCKNFILIDVPKTGHSNSGSFHEPSIGPIRRKRFVMALKEEISKLREQPKFINQTPESSENLSGQAKPEVKDVVFVVHGIRDYGDWTTHTRICIEEIAGEYAVAITPAYDRFPMLDFLRRSKRRRKVEWFVNEYTIALARYPNARFHFIGHSNGTYLLANALERYEMMEFDRVVFAGSVVRRNYRWNDVIDEQERVEGIANVRGADDWVVAVFPRFPELLREVTGAKLSDLGGAGVFGFQDNAGRRDEVLIRGGHSAGIDRDNHDSLVRYVLGMDETLKLDPGIIVKKISPRTQWLATFSWLVWLLLLIIPCLLAFGAIQLWPFPWLPILGPLLAVGGISWWLLKTL